MIQQPLYTADSQTIHLLRFPLVCLVVAIHCFSFVDGWDINRLNFNTLSGVDIYSLFCISLSTTLAQISVPAFFLISGFLFFRGLEKWEWQSYFVKMQKRIYSLFIPYMAWNSICILKNISQKLGGGNFK